jgi:hypothetical protein
VPSEQLVEHDAERINVAGGGDGLTAQLLGARVFRSEGVHHGGFEAAGGAYDFRDAEIKQLRHAIGGDQDVAGLEIAVNHQVLVRVVHGGANRQKELEPLLDGERTDRAVGVDGRAFDQFHHQVGDASSVVAPSSRRAMLG